MQIYCKPNYHFLSGHDRNVADVAQNLQRDDEEVEFRGFDGKIVFPIFPFDGRQNLVFLSFQKKI